MKGGLGRGLSSLIPSKPADAAPAPKPVAAPSELPKGAVEVVPAGDRVLHVSPKDIVTVFGAWWKHARIA